MKAKYVAGFLFNRERTLVILIKKNKPEWQKGKLNAVGGHVEDDETSIEAMTREFQEEAGVEIKNWELFAHLHDTRNYVVDFFYAVDETAFWAVQSKIDEELCWLTVADISTANVIPNLRWLVPMALSMENDRAVLFNIEEH